MGVGLSLSVGVAASPGSERPRRLSPQSAINIAYRRRNFPAEHFGDFKAAKMLGGADH
jgi:hypothetical protein